MDTQSDKEAFLLYTFKWIKIKSKNLSIKQIDRTSFVA